MLMRNFSALCKTIACGVICTLPSFGNSQEAVALPLAVANGLPEQIATNIALELQDEASVETLTRGPLHEAFAEPIIFDPVPGLIVAIEPPAEINEIAPEFRPEGDDLIWISGYWGWDDQREDFIWISGVYRVPPDGYQWVPGYWHPVGEGWQWVQGLWVKEVAESIVYFPAPPATLENGPSSPSPGTNHFYIPGNWSQSSSGYQWNVGYWHPLQDDFIWVPAHTVWTPRGYIFVNGYWDRRLPLRGMCFAPVFIPRETYSRPGWSLRPNVVLNSQVVLHNLFVQPGYNHYVFGDYYGLPSNRRNVIPAHVYHQHRGSYDPLISFYTAYNGRQGQDLIRWYDNQHADLNRNPSKRPPQHWSPNPLNANDKTSHSSREMSSIAHTLEQVSKFDGGQRISPITASVKQDLLKRDVDRKGLAKDRKALEGNVDPVGSTSNGGILPSTFAMPKLELPNRSNDPTSRIGKMPEQPRNSNRDRLNPDSMANKRPGEVKSARGDTNKLERRRPADPNLSVSPALRESKVSPGARLDPIPKVVPPGVETQQKKSKPPAVQIPNPSPLPKLQPPLPNLQPPVLSPQFPPVNRIPSSTENRTRSNRESGKGNEQKEIRNKPPVQQIGPFNLSPPPAQSLPPAKQPSPRAQSQPPAPPLAPPVQRIAPQAPRNPPPAQQFVPPILQKPEHQPKQERPSNRDGNADKKGGGKKPK